MERAQSETGPSDPVLNQLAAGLSDGRPPSNEELAAALRQAAEQGRLPSRPIISLVAKRIEAAELAFLAAAQQA